MSQSGILNRGVYPPGTVVETIQGSNSSVLVAPPISPDGTNNIILNSTNGNLTFSNGVGNILNMTVSTSPIVSYVSINNTNSPYTAAATTEYISCDTSGGAIIINLPSAGVAQGECWTIKDRTGDANTNNITIQSLVGGKTIDTAPTFVINLSFGSVQIIYNGTNFEVF
jgi:hypothetical protein